MHTWSLFVSKARLVTTLCALLVSLPAAPSWAVPVLWGVDEDTGKLFRIVDYTNPTTNPLTSPTNFTNFGLLKRDATNTVGDHIDAFTLEASGLAFMAINKTVGSTSGPVLAKFDVSKAILPTGVNPNPNILTTLTHISGAMGDITGLTLHPSTGDLFGLDRVGGDSTVDRLVKINKTTGAVTAVGNLQGLSGPTQIVGAGEDLVFDHLGNLYVTDAQDDHLYKVNPATGAITALLDNNENGGLGGSSSVFFEALAWDFQNSKLLGFDDANNIFAQLTFPSDGSNVKLFVTTSSPTDLDLHDIEGMAFLPSAAVVPEPGTLLLLGSGLVGLGGSAWRRRRRVGPEEG